MHRISSMPAVNSVSCRLFFIYSFLQRGIDHLMLLLDLKGKKDYREHLKSEALEYHIRFQGSNALVVGELLWNSYK